MTLRKSPSNILAFFGTATLVGGVLSGIAAGCPTSPDKCTIILSRNTPGGTLGFLQAPAAQRGADVITFRILSTNGADTSTVNWVAIPKLNSAEENTNTASFRRPPSGSFVVRGTTTLVAGTKSVSTGMQFSENAKVFVCARTLAGTTGKLSAPQASLNPSTGVFVINSNSGTDTSTIDWIVIDSPGLRSSPSGAVIGAGSADMVSSSAAFTNMNPLNDAEVSIMVSVIDAAGTPGNLSAPANNRLSGAYVVVSSVADDDTSRVETLCI